jgi:hypothetical protein
MFNAREPEPIHFFEISFYGGAARLRARIDRRWIRIDGARGRVREWLSDDGPTTGFHYKYNQGGSSNRKKDAIIGLEDIGAIVERAGATRCNNPVVAPSASLPFCLAASSLLPAASVFHPDRPTPDRPTAA